ncbi:MAG TPA: hypothetical protein VNQ33_01905 [Acidimicrobiales bacterium]|nr:hypothetical protein [Acidimicrobiales bacterium]
MNAVIRPAAVRCCVVLAVTALTIGSLLAPPATAAPARIAAPPRPVGVAGAALPDPGVAGPEAVDELSYDFGDQAYRPTGFPAAVEVKAKVYAPQTIAGRAPLVILQHGRHATCATATVTLLEWPCPASVPEIPSYQGYDALGRLLASHGMVVVSIGANGINANDGFLDDGGASARGQLILEHLRRWKGWDASATGAPFGSRFVGRIDLDRIGLMGHSRGGEGIAAAVQLNQRSVNRFGIKAAMALAPVDFGRRVIGGVELGVILPYCDGDVYDLQGASYYDDGRYATPGDTSSKMTALLYGANHNFFNTVWTSGPGSFDDAGVFIEGGGQDTRAAADPCRPGGSGRLTAAQQEQAGAALMAGFLRRTLGPEPNLQPLVTGTAPYPPSTSPARWSIAYHAGDRLDIESWASADTYRRTPTGQVTDIRGVNTGLVCNPSDEGGFGQPDGVRVVTTRCAAATFTGLVNDTGALDAGWIRQGTSVRIPFAAAGIDVAGYDGVRMRVAVPNDTRNAARAKQDFTVVLEDADGHRAAVPALSGTNGLQRLNAGTVQHAVLNGVRLPLSSFAGIDVTRVRAIELRFDRTGAGRLAIADLAFTQEGLGSAAANTTGVGPITPPASPCRRTSAARWACAVGQLAWGRDPTTAEISWLGAGYATAAGRKRIVARALGGPTAHGLRHAQFLQTYLQDEVDPAWVSSSLSANGKKHWDTATVDLVGAFAFSSASLATPDDVVRAAYESILGRPADTGGLAHWAPKVRNGGARAMAANLVRTEAARGRIVDERYAQVLGRAADPAGRAYWVKRLATPGGEQALMASLMATEAFRTWAIR